MVSAIPTPDEAESSRLDHVDISDAHEKNVQTNQQSIGNSDEAPEAPRTTVSSSSTNVGKSPSDLPLSKGKAIALVATVTGAAFLNVSISLSFHEYLHSKHQLLQTLSLQSVVIILPTIGEDINIPDSRLQWIVSAYSLTFGCFLLLWGRIADIYGKRLLFIGGSIWVTIVTAVNPFMPNEISFDLMRGLHGLVCILHPRIWMYSILTPHQGSGCKCSYGNRHPWRHLSARESKELRFCDLW